MSAAPAAPARLDPGLSLYLDLVRVTAALAVVLTHVAYEEIGGGSLKIWRELGNNAVMVFFVLSGFVIAHVVDGRERTARDYALSRLARLWSVAVPALVLTILIDAAGRQIAPEVYASAWWAQTDQPWLRIASALSFTNEFWFSSVRAFSNGPWWSLSYEAAYYALFGVAVFASGARRAWLLGGLALLIGPKILLLFPVWLLGVATYRWSRRNRLSPARGAFQFAASLVIFAAVPLLGVQQLLLGLTLMGIGGYGLSILYNSGEFLASYLLGALVAAHFIGAAAIAPQLGRALDPAAAFIRWVAQFTFAIYLVHYPLMRLIDAAAPADAASLGHAALVFAGAVGGSIAVGLVTERQKPRVRRWLDALTGGLRPTARAARLS